MKYGWFTLRDYMMVIPTVVTLVLFIVYVSLRAWLPNWAFWVFFWWYALIFGVADIIYNAIAGTFIWLEWPREWFYTDRLKRLDDDPVCAPCVFHHKSTLNYFDPEHV